MDRFDTKKKVILGLVLTALVFGAGYFSKGSSTVTEIKEVVKTVTVVQEAKTKIVYREVTTLPDGTKKEIERSREDTNTNIDSSSESTKNSKKVETRDIGLTLSALAIVDASSISGHRDYGVHVTKRVLGNVNVGVLATTDKKIGLSVGLSF